MQREPLFQKILPPTRVAASRLGPDRPPPPPWVPGRVTVKVSFGVARASFTGALPGPMDDLAKSPKGRRGRKTEQVFLPVARRWESRLHQGHNSIGLSKRRVTPKPGL
jgi:hypothetical protein